MEWNLINKQWPQLITRAKQHWDKLTDDDLQEINGTKLTLIEKLQERYGFHRDDAERHVYLWSRELSYSDLIENESVTAEFPVPVPAQARGSAVDITPPGAA
jgi:uncharacterized protein YjbJ (UPF0337 family)